MILFGLSLKFAVDRVLHSGLCCPFPSDPIPRRLSYGGTHPSMISTRYLNPSAAHYRRLQGITSSNSQSLAQTEDSHRTMDPSHAKHADGSYSTTICSAGKFGSCMHLMHVWYHLKG
jgi:hypothetical protein